MVRCDAYRILIGEWAGWDVKRIGGRRKVDNMDMVADDGDGDGECVCVEVVGDRSWKLLAGSINQGEKLFTFTIAILTLE